MARPGLRSLVINAAELFRGMSTTDELNDGGFSPKSKGINLFASPGLILPGPAPADQTSAVSTKGIFAWSTHHTNVNPGIGRAISADNSFVGKFLQLSDAGAATLAASDNTKAYKPMVTDMIRYDSSNHQYVSSNTDIAQCTFDFGTVIPNWWTSTLSLTALGGDVPHLFIDFNAVMFVTDGRYLHSWNGSAGTYAALSLPVNYVITGVEVHNNLIYMAAAKYDPLGGGESIECSLFTWDGFSASYLEQIPVQERIDCLKVFGGTLFCTTRSYIGYFTGSTIAPLYPLAYSAYKYQVAITEDRMYILQGQDVLCYGNPVVSKPKFFSFPLRHSSTLVGICSYRRGQMVYGYASASGAWSNVDGSDLTGVTFYANKMSLAGSGGRYSLGAMGKARFMVTEFQALASAASMDIGYIDDTQTTQLIETVTYASLGAVTKRRSDEFGPGTRTVQPYITFNTGTNSGIRRIDVEFDHSEETES
jgi:hypothetical protein